MTVSSFSPVDIAERRTLPVRPGCTVRVHQKIVDKGKTRIQVFEGIVIARKHGTEPGATFTVRRVGSDGVAVEKIFPLFSPMIDRVEVVRFAAVRRARLYFLRDKTPKQIREKLKRVRSLPVTAPETSSEPTEAATTPPSEPEATISEDSPEEVSPPSETTASSSVASPETENTSSETSTSKGISEESPSSEDASSSESRAV